MHVANHGDEQLAIAQTKLGPDLTGAPLLGECLVRLQVDAVVNLHDPAGQPGIIAFECRLHIARDTDHSIEETRVPRGRCMSTLMHDDRRPAQPGGERPIGAGQNAVVQMNEMRANREHGDQARHSKSHRSDQVQHLLNRQHQPVQWMIAACDQ